MALTSASIYRFLKSKTERGLEMKMLLNNRDRKCFHQYQIMHNGKEYVAWYIVDLSGMANKDMMELGEETNGAS